MSDHVLSVENLCKSYPTPKGSLDVLKGVSFQLERGKTCAVMGPSGSGKSTLLHLLGGLDAPSAGLVAVAGEDLARKSAGALAAFRNTTVGFVFQFHHLLPEFTARENAAMPLLIAGRSKREAFARADELLNSVSLAERDTHRPYQLSGGEQQRVALARALALRPALLLADEPTGNLDESSALDVQELLWSQVLKEKTAMVIVTHDAALAKRADMVYHLEHGVLKDGPYTARGKNL